MQAALRVSVGSTALLQLTGICYLFVVRLTWFPFIVVSLGPTPYFLYGIVSILPRTRGRANVLRIGLFKNPNLTISTVLLSPSSWHATFTFSMLSRDQPGLRSIACANAHKNTMIRMHYSSDCFTIHPSRTMMSSTADRRTRYLSSMKILLPAVHALYPMFFVTAV